MLHNDNMKVLLATICLFFTTLTLAQNEVKPLQTNTVLYKISHPDLNKTSYLFGTHHAFGKPFFDSLHNATEALSSSTLLIKENLNLPGQLAEDYINKRTETIKWKKYLSPQDLAYVQNILSGSRVNIDKMSPAELYAFLGRRYKERICLDKDSTATYFSLDDYIGSIAENQGIQVIGLETTEEQIRLINQDVKGMPRKVHKKRLRNMVSQLRSGNKDHCAEIDWYSEMNFDFKLSEPCQNALILGDRNKKWMINIQNHLQTDDCFIVIGLSHLMFECGLINHLQELGYIITPIPVK